MLQRDAKVSSLFLFIALLTASQSLQCRAEGPSHSSSMVHSTVAQEPGLGESLGDLQMMQKHYAAAIDYYRNVTPATAVTLNKIGVAYHHMYGFKVAKGYYEQAIALNPKYSPALNNLGAIFYGEENYKAAEKCYRKAIKLDPKSAKAYKNLGTAYFSHGKISRGIEQYRAAFSLDPELFAADDAIAEPTTDDNRAIEYYALARLFAEAGKDETAIDYLKKALAAGFSDRKRMMNDADFAGIRSMPEFARLAPKI